MQQQQQKWTGTVELFKKEEIISSNYVSSLTPEIAKQSAQLSLLKKEVGIQETGIMISKIINEISLLTNTTMDAGVKNLCAKMIVNNYWNLKIDELLLIIRDGILGKYGKIYGNFCFTTLTEWVDKFFNEKLGNCEFDNLQHTSHEKVIRHREVGINPQENLPEPLEEKLRKMNEFWRPSDE